MGQLRTTTSTSNSNDGDETTPPKLRRQTRPKSHAERIFNFDKHIPIQDIQFTNKMLGRGQFGQVELAYVTIKGVTKECAVKMIRGTLFKLTVFVSIIKKSYSESWNPRNPSRRENWNMKEFSLELLVRTRIPITLNEVKQGVLCITNVQIDKPLICSFCHLGRGTVEDERELFEELQMLYQIPHHPNVVSLLGGCMDEECKYSKR